MKRSLGEQDHQRVVAAEEAKDGEGRDIEGIATDLRNGLERGIQIPAVGKAQFHDTDMGPLAVDCLDQVRERDAGPPPQLGNLEVTPQKPRLLDRDRIIPVDVLRRTGKPNPGGGVLENAVDDSLPRLFLGRIATSR